MIYPAFAFKDKDGKVAIFCFDQQGAYGPFVIYGWDKEGTVTGNLDEGSVAFLFCSFCDGTSPITAREHADRVRDGEDGRNGVYNLFCSGHFFYNLSLGKNGAASMAVHEEIRSRENVLSLMKYITSQFDELWNLAMDNGYSWAEAERKLGCRFDERSLSGFNQSRHEPLTP